MGLTLHIEVTDVAHNEKYGSMDLLLELLLVLLLLLLVLYLLCNCRGGTLRADLYEHDGIHTAAAPEAAVPAAAPAAALTAAPAADPWIHIFHYEPYFS